MDPARHRPLPICDGRGNRLPRLHLCSSLAKEEASANTAKVREDPGTRMLHGHDTASAQIPPVQQDGGKSRDCRYRPPPASSLSPVSPTGARSPGQSGCTCARCPPPRYLVESDCIQGKGALGVQAAAALRSREEQEEQEKGKQLGERSGAGNGGSHNAGFWQ